MTRIAMLSVHACPLARLGGRDSGGMNVYVREVARRLARLGVDVDVFTRCAGRGGPTVLEYGPGNRVIQLSGDVMPPPTWPASATAPSSGPSKPGIVS